MTSPMRFILVDYPTMSDHINPFFVNVRNVGILATQPNTVIPHPVAFYLPNLVMTVQISSSVTYMCHLSRLHNISYRSCFAYKLDGRPDKKRDNEVFLFQLIPKHSFALSPDLLPPPPFLLPSQHTPPFQPLPLEYSH